MIMNMPDWDKKSIKNFNKSENLKQNGFYKTTMKLEKEIDYAINCIKEYRKIKDLINTLIVI